MNSLGTDRLAEAIKDGLIGGREDFGNSRSGTLKISVTTILKPSTAMVVRWIDGGVLLFSAALGLATQAGMMKSLHSFAIERHFIEIA